ncbi:MAG: Beta-xylosidase [Opitutia bacterium UBA7350]|nr:MAG: Beta-xylosidase [Opitutae bacterium UBA7350]
MGAHASFTIGMQGAEGGMALERGSPADSAVFVGYRAASGQMVTLPFYKDISNEAERYSKPEEAADKGLTILNESEIQREYAWATDCFAAKGITFKVTTPFCEIPDPATADEASLKFACLPATFLELTLRNDSKEKWEGFFALQGGTPWSPVSQQRAYRGAVTRGRMGFASDSKGVEEFVEFGVEQALERKQRTPSFALGPVAGISFVVDPGASKTVRIILGYFIEGQATFNFSAQYWYTRHFSNIYEVFDYAFEHEAAYLKLAAERDVELAKSGLSDSQQFLIAHATRSYYGSSEWLVDAAGKPLWVINEGEYLMMNTLDLTVDMIFYELKFNPWTVRNVLEQFVSRYQYEDQIFSPEDPSQLLEGGVSFTHDMGVGNHFSPSQYSCYECVGIDRKCFSYMTCEQLTNWVLCAGLYVKETGDDDFLRQHKDLLGQCLQSLLNRDHPDPAQRDGLMSFESSRTKGGGEITTYDSLDHSLGQARRNVYLGGKCWASYLALEMMLGSLGDAERVAEARAAAVRCAETLTESFDESLGFIPAVLDGKNTSAIIPAVEALIYPWKMGMRDLLTENGVFGDFIKMLKQHTTHVLKPGVCLYDDGGWKLSSSADNSWMSKICLNQLVVREILGIHYGEEARADDAHVFWEINGSKFQACSDQFASGQPIGSLYYPRIVTNILWLDSSAMKSDAKAPVYTDAKCSV